ncbi:hypothetical protein [Methyloglobulus sp.]|uniref:hypothetical protein n=1 Tax=Methyloglobulus sp. TaxID=2518622 RepID=UPI0039892C05
MTSFFAKKCRFTHPSEVVPKYLSSRHISQEALASTAYSPALAIPHPAPSGGASRSPQLLRDRSREVPRSDRAGRFLEAFFA